MKNELTQQIVALYIGQKCDAVWVNGPNKDGTHERIIDGTCLSLMENNAITHRISITPHLRPLSSLTEAEARELYLIHQGHEWSENPYSKPGWKSNPDGTGECLTEWWGFKFNRYAEISAHQIGSPAVLLRLLEWGFDLFGGIESGWAKEIEDKI